ncbi:zinc-binding dehydrogenase [Paenibacillus sp. SYP-B3998]|uniref:Zinc-binding dehydrogenase n=1 Tax=Paenibacillus sp. SYP-B3998 TaxID=2678564 RepID=A0A6G3ZZ01_9BACL|nr:zinc-binding dehydrogenase [Paenibacillus sp. SYP-B3998]NEW06801.1 zinc-binding dehydrogenase [Paenibacillus sp. SYP-B3998]
MMISNKTWIKLGSEICKAGLINRQYPLDQAAEAHRYADTGRKRGNVIIATSLTS